MIDKNYFKKYARITHILKFSGESVGICVGYDEQYMRVAHDNWWRFETIGRRGEEGYEEKAVYLTDNDEVTLLEEVYQKHNQATKGGVMDIEFWTTLIEAEPIQTDKAMKSLQGNCTYVDNFFYIFEGDIEVLQEDGVKFCEHGEGAVPCLGDMSQGELVKLCWDVFGVYVSD